MIDDIWRTCCRSQDSAGKGYSTHHILEDQEIPKIYILPEDGSSQKK
jgi:hypothetical protein